MTAFDRGLLGHHCWLELATGERIDLPVNRWTAIPCDGDDVLLDACDGPTLDVGCGPGRLTAALTERGVASLGIDISATAVRLTHDRGAAAICRDVFDRLPGEGRWRHVLLADGNIGIGGNPHRLLARMAELIADSGTVLVELDPPGRGVRQDRVRLLPDNGAWFTWAWVGVEAIADLAARTALRVAWFTSHGRRWFACLEKS